MDENGKLFKAKDDYIVAEISPSGEGKYQVWGRKPIESGLGHRHSFVSEFDQFNLACGQAKNLVNQYEQDHDLT